MKRHTKAHWLAALESAKVPCGAINNLAEVFADEQVQHRQMTDTWQHPLCGTLRLVASPMKLGATPVRGPSNGGIAPPLLGQHTDEVLIEILNHSSASLSDLRVGGVI